jgi:hypothetical protein
MKIPCHCGAQIIDQSDDLPHKGHVIPDQEWFATLDALDAEIIDVLADGRIDKDAAYQRVRQIVGRAARRIWQCRSCGQLYVDDPRHELQCYVPEGDATAKDILRGERR